MTAAPFSQLLTGLFAGIAAAPAVKMASGERLVLARARPCKGCLVICCP